MIFENQKNAIYDFDLPAHEEALIIECFADEMNDLLFPFLECNFEVLPEWEDFVKDRARFIIPDKIFKHSSSRVEDELVYWYNPLNFKELVKIIEFDHLTYSCMVIPRYKELDDWRFKLFTHEHAMYKDKETRALWITESKVGDYSQNIVHRIHKLVNET